MGRCKHGVEMGDFCDICCKNHAKLRESARTPGCVVDLTKIAELGQACAQFELIRRMATEAQTRYSKHLELCDLELMGEIAGDANIIIQKIMAASDQAR